MGFYYETGDIEKMAFRMRRTALKMAHAAGKSGAHLGGGLSCIEILAVLYGAVADVRADDPLWGQRDRILISKAHCVLAYYTALREMGFLTDEDIAHFEQNGYDMPGHPLRNQRKGIEYAAGSLGMAPSVAVGMALDAKLKNRENKVYVLLGDGECEEGAVWEAFLSASHYKLDNLVVIIDRNHLQYDGTTEEVAGLDKISQKLAAFGFKVVEVNGHDIGALLDAFREGAEEKPLAVIADTVKGKGVSFMENNLKWHHGVMSEKEFQAAMEELGEET